MSEKRAGKLVGWLKSKRFLSRTMARTCEGFAPFSFPACDGHARGSASGKENAAVLGHAMHYTNDYSDRRVVRESLRDPRLQSWPNGAGLAVWTVFNVECWPSNTLGGGGSSAVPKPPDIRNQTFRDYGLRAGVWRLIDMHDRLQWPVSIALNGAVCDVAPDVVQAFADRSWDIMGHGIDQSRGLPFLKPGEEEADIAWTLDRIQAFTGKRPKGWLGPGLAETADTPDILSRHGVDYIADRVDDDVPYYIRTQTKPLVAVPYSVNLNDLPAFTRQNFSAPQFAEMIVDSFEVLLKESAKTPRVLCIPLHTYLSGVPFRAKHIEKAFAHLKTHKNAWFATGADIARHYRAVTQ